MEALHDRQYMDHHLVPWPCLTKGWQPCTDQSSPSAETAKRLFTHQREGEGERRGGGQQQEKKEQWELWFSPLIFNFKKSSTLQGVATAKCFSLCSAEIVFLSGLPLLYVSNLRNLNSALLKTHSYKALYKCTVSLLSRDRMHTELN